MRQNLKKWDIHFQKPHVVTNLINLICQTTGEQEDPKKLLTDVTWRVAWPVLTLVAYSND